MSDYAMLRRLHADEGMGDIINEVAYIPRAISSMEASRNARPGAPKGPQA